MTRWRRSSVERRLLELLHGRQTRTRLPEIHARFLRHHLDQSNTLLAHFVSVAASLGDVRYARLAFLSSHDPDLVLFNSVIKAHSLHPPTSRESFLLFSTMRSRGIRPDRFTFAPVLKSCCNFSDPMTGVGVHAMTVVAGLDSRECIRIGLMELYSGCGCMRDAQKVFDAMPCGNVIMWNLLVCGYCRTGDMDNGYRLFRRMSGRNVVTWNTMISALGRSGRDGQALELFKEMLDFRFEPDDATLVTILPVCGRLGAISVGKWIHDYALSKGLLEAAVNVGNSLVDMYSKCGDLRSAYSVFSGMRRKNVVSWNTMILAFAVNGEGKVGVDMFDEMQRQGIVPNDATYIGALSCCTHAGLVQKGREFFQSMVEEHSIEARLEHFGCMVDLLGRCGYVREALELITSMPIKPSAAIWGALLSSSRIHGDLNVAECAATELISLEPWNSGNYVLLSNVYSEAGRWEDMEKVRALMRKNSVKSAGKSLIESK